MSSVGATMPTSEYKQGQYVAISQEYKRYMHDQADNIFRVFGFHRTNTKSLTFIQNLDTMDRYAVPDYFIEPIDSKSMSNIPEGLL